MSHTNSTTNYALPQFLTNDKPAWLTDINNAFSDIDTAVYAAKSKADTAFTDAGNAQTDATTAINNASAADAKGSGALASIEVTFDPTTIYSVGARVIYNSLLYRCIVAVTTPGPWTGSDNWERITVDNLISATDSKIGQLSSLSTTDKTNVVNAVNEVNGLVQGLLVFDVATGTVNINANNYADPVATIPVHAGYTCKGVTGLYVNNTNVVVGAYYMQDSNTKIKVVLRNVTSSAQTGVEWTTVLIYVKD